MATPFDQMAEVFDTSRGLPGSVPEAIAQVVVRITGASPATRFLEPGVGTGRIALPLVRSGYPYVGVDLSAGMLRAFRRKLDRPPHRAVLVRADATALPFPDSSFDVALTAHIFYLIPDWRRALAELRRVLRRDGLFLYCYEDGVSNDALAAFDRAWHEILAARGLAAGWQTSVDDQTVLRCVQDQGATIETVTAAVWRNERSVGESLATYAARMRPLYREVPDAVFDAAISHFASWARVHIPSDDTALSYRTTFRIVVARDWAARLGARAESAVGGA